MNQKNENDLDEQIRQWAEEYKRIFGSASDGVSLSEGDLIPPDEMRRYVDNYRKSFEVASSKDELELKLDKLTRIRNGWQLTVDCLDKIITYIENQRLDR